MNLNLHHGTGFNADTPESHFEALDTLAKAPEVDPSRLPTLSKQFKDLIYKASKRSIFDLETLVGYLRVQPSLTHYPEIHDIFLSFLEVEPPHPLTPEHGETIELALISFYGILRNLSTSVLTLDRCNSYIGTKFLQAWPSIWKWMKYLFYNSSLGETYSSSTEISTLDLRIMVSIGHFISVVATRDASPLWKLMGSTPGLFTMVVKLWMVQPNRKPDDRSLPSDCSRLTCTLGTFLKLKWGERSTETDPRRVQELANMLGQDKHQIATLLLWYIRTIASRNGIWELSFPLLMDVTTAVSLSIPGVSNVLLSQNALVEICRAMRVFASTDTQSGTFRHNQMICIAKCVHYFLAASLATDGFTWIIQALRSGILFSVVRSSMWNEEMALIVDLVLETIAPYTAYRSVLRVLGKILQNSEFSRLEAQLENNTHFHQEWKKFKGVVEENLAIKAAYDAGGKYSQPCAASGCHNLETIRSFQYCAACQDACYCSRACQQRDWKSGRHREVCKKLRQDRADGIPAQLSPRDVSFFTHLSVYDMCKHHDEILRLRDEQLKVQPSTRHAFVIGINRLDSPPKISVTTAEGLKQWRTDPRKKPKLPLPDKNAIPIRARNTLVFPVMAIPNGAHGYTMPIEPDIASKLFGWKEQSSVAVVGSGIGDEGVQDYKLPAGFPYNIT